MSTNPNVSSASFAVRVTLAWVVVAVVTFLLVKVVKIGPTIFVLSEERGWGVHSGDFLFLIPVVVATALTVKWARARKA